jgi:TetR/AcrR family fatty acid metabolism transcriptional regulator
MMKERRNSLDLLPQDGLVKMKTTKNAHHNSTNATEESMDTREHVFRSALAVMKRKGYARTTIRDICKEARVSIGTFYLYYDNKNEIFMDVYKQADDYFYEVVSEKLKKIPGFKARIFKFFHEYANLQITTGIDMLKILYTPDNSWFARRRPMQITLDKIIAEAQQSGELDPALAVEDIEGYLFNVARGCCYDWCINNGNFDLATRMDHYIRLAYNGLQMKSGDR